MKQIFTLKYFLKIFRNSLPVFFSIVLLPVLYSQDTLYLSLGDTADYDINYGCSKVDSSKWSVKKDSCVIYMPYLRKETVGTTTLCSAFRINQSANMESDDVAYFQIKRDSSEWVTDTILYGSNYEKVHTLKEYNSMNYGETIRFRVALKTNDQTEVWSLFWGGSTITGSFVTYTDWPPPLEDLPVKLDYFSGSYLNDALVVKWATFSETNSDYFNIERSTDGLNYETVAFVDGAGYSNEYLKYVYVDEDNVAAKEVYYKLKQVDMDGKFEYFGPIAVSNPEKPCVNISPVPAETFSPIFVSFPNSQCDRTQVQVFNESGRQLMNSYVEGPDFVFVVSDPGLYIVAVTGENQKAAYCKLTVR